MSISQTGRNLLKKRKCSADTVTIRIKYNDSAFILFCFYLDSVTCQDNDTILRKPVLIVCSVFWQ